jgi:RNA polymerase sigma factor (TIGR02999 family)
VAVATSLQPDTVALLMASFRNGDHEAAGRLVEIFYPELRRIAAARMRAERPDHTLQPTAVVHQLYLELVKVKALRPTSSEGGDEKAAFLKLAAFLMKRLLIHHARPLARRAEKAELPDLPGPHSLTEHSLLEIDDILNRLAAINPALRQVVELRVFEGLTREEMARRMGCGPATIARHWSFARNWLEEAFAGTPGL